MRFGKSKDEAQEEPGRGGGGGDFIKYLKEGNTTFRILQEQEEWKYYWEHFSPEGYSFPCPRDVDDPIEMCPGCSSDNEKMKKVSRKIAFNALHSFNGTEYVDVFKIGPMVSDKLENRIKRYGTITDRDYTISKYKSSGDRWDFDVEGGTPTPVDLRKEDWKDIEAMLQQAWDDAWNSPEKKVWAEPEEPASRPRVSIAPAPQSEEPPFEEKVYKEADLRKLDHEVLLKLIKDEMDVVPPATLVTTDAVVDWMMDLQS
jgi:hypothetical protein